MTGIERLRKLTDATLGHVRVASITHYYEDENDVEWDDGMHLSELLASIYSQINREQDAMVADSPYEALPPEDREAIAWVREHGGLDHVKAEWRSSVPYDLYERRRQRLLGHIAECETALRRRNQRIEELGRTIEFFQLNNSNFRHLLADVAERLGFTRYGDDYEPEDLLDALDCRLMPEGYEWPRYDTGEPVRFGDEFLDHQGNVRSVLSVKMFQEGGFEIGTGQGTYDWHSAGERVKRPAPAVPAGDDEPLEVGQTVWDADGMEFRVESFDSNGVWGSWKTDDGWIKAHPCPTLFTHQRPVLDADGVPIKKGDTVYWLEHTAPFTVVSPHETRDNAGRELECGHTVEVMRDGHELHMYVHPESLHHTKPEPPDSWERIGEDAKKDLCSYFGMEGGGYGCSECQVKHWEESCDVVRSRDLVRRCRALAERERGER